MITINKALAHLQWRFTNGWKPTEKDIEAYNEIVSFADQKMQQQFNDNQLFAKLYITMLGELLIYYNTTVMDNTPQKALNKILDTPIEVIIKKFLKKANLQEQVKADGTNKDHLHPLAHDTSHIDINAEAMSYNEAIDNLTTMINMAINKYN